MVRIACTGVLLLTVAATVLPAQAPPTAPVVSPRGVVNAYSQVPAPSQVTPGGIIWISGLNLGPAQGAKASGLPLPVELAGVSVLVNNRPAPLYSVSPSRIEAQVPVETPNGAAVVIVRRDGASTRPARINVMMLSPAIRAVADRSYGEAAITPDGETAIKFQATGLGQTEPRAITGEAGPEGATLVNPVRVYIGGVLAPNAVEPSADRPGEFTITAILPASAKPGDVLNLVAGTNIAATPRRLYKTASEPLTKFLPLPATPTPDIRAIAGSDLRGEFAMAAGPRREDGCYNAYRLDFASLTFTTVDPCVTAGNRNQPNPFTPALEAGSIAALLGPPEGELPEGVSSKLAVFSPVSAETMKAELPGLATNVISQNGDFRVQLANGGPAAAVLVGSETGEVSPAPAPAGGGVGGAVPGGGGQIGANAGCLNPNLNVDLGDGLTKIVSCAQAAQLFAATIVDDETNPTKAKLAVMTAQGQIQTSSDFPEGFLPMILPAIQNPGPGGGGAGGAVASRLRGVTVFDLNTVYVIVRAKDGSGDAFATFAGNPQQPQPQPTPPPLIRFPDGWFAASCTPQLRVFNLDLARQIGFPASKTAEKDARANCPAYGFVLLNRDTRATSVSESPGREGFNAASQAGDVADFIYTVSTNPQRPAIAESLYVLDSTNGSAFRLDLPSGVLGFGQVREELTLFSLFAPANATPNGNGDAGIAVFDLESASTRLLPTPDGFAAVQILGIFDASRKVVARGMRPANAGSAILIYDLQSGDLYIPPAPASCNFAGVLPQTPGQPGQPPQQQPQANTTLINPKANTITVGCYDANRRLSGFLFVKSN
jgi:uncharacterized protein (TIGR03437 family)